MTDKTKANRFSALPVADVDENSESQSPTQESASEHPQLSQNASSQESQLTNSRGKDPDRVPKGRIFAIALSHLSLPINERMEERSSHKTGRETKDGDVQDSRSPQQTNRNTPSAGRRNDSQDSTSPLQTDRSTPSRRKSDLQDNSSPQQTDRSTPSKKRNDSQGSPLQQTDRSTPSKKRNDSQGSPLQQTDRSTPSKKRDDSQGSPLQQTDRSTNHKRRSDSQGSPLQQTDCSTPPKTRSGSQGSSLQQTDRSAPARKRKDSGHNNRQGQTRDEVVYEDVEEGGENKVVGEEEEEEVKATGINEPPTNQGPRRSDPPRQNSNRKKDSARDAITRLEGSLKRKEHDCDLLSTRNEQLTAEINNLKEAFSRVQLERDNTSRLLNERTAELSSAQLFLGQADTSSVADVSRMVDMLNAEISQASISIVDSLSEGSANIDQTELNRLLNKWGSSIGSCLCDILARRLCEPVAELDPMITQLALQAGLSKACHLIINDWNPPLWFSSSAFDRVYSSMRLSEGQVIAGRWRALARTYINGQAGQDSVDGIQTHDTKNKIREANTDYLVSVLSELLTIVGWSPRDPHRLPSEYSEKMRFLSGEALKLHETIGRGITSRDLIVEVIPCDTPFNPAAMEDVDRQRGKPGVIPNDLVACTVELGLIYKSAKPGGESGETSIILKPKVLLASTLAEGETETTPAKTKN